MPDFQYFYEYEVQIENPTYRGTQGKGRCPLGTHQDKKPSFSFSLDNGQCKCFSCGWKGNAYLLAKALNMNNPEKMINGETTLPKPSNHVPSAPINNSLGDQAQVYIDRIPKQHLKELPKLKAMKVGYTEEGLKVFNYLNEDGKVTGIKIHKSYWEAGDKSCQIYGLNLLKKYDRSKPLIICEGETDMLVSPNNSISFSAGAGAIPNDLSPLLDFSSIYICYDHDTPGREGAERLAERIKTESRGIKVYINNWSEHLPEGYDIRDEFTKYKHDNDYKYEELKNSIKHAVEYKLPSNGYHVINTSNLTDTYNTPPKPIIQYLLYEQGVSLVAGTDGVGKTWFVLQMAYSIASGTDFLGFKVTQKEVLLIQFELTPEQLSNRVKAVQPNYPQGTNVQIALFNDDDMMFTDQWQKIKDTIDDIGLRDSVVMIDNLYVSSNQDLSDNNALQQILAMIQSIKTKTGNSIVLVGHHNKSYNDEEPILSKGLIHGGKHLTNYVHNVFQIGESTLGTDLRRGKITKVRDEHCELNGEAFKLNWNREQVMFERGAVIVNEKMHCISASEKWEIALIKEFFVYAKEKDFDRKYMWNFLESSKGWMPTTYNINNKLTRYLKTMTKWGYITKSQHGLYSFNHEECG